MLGKVRGVKSSFKGLENKGFIVREKEGMGKGILKCKEGTGEKVIRNRWESYSSSVICVVEEDIK